MNEATATNDQTLHAGQEQHQMFTTWMTCSIDRFEHAVTDEQSGGAVGCIGRCAAT